MDAFIQDVRYGVRMLLRNPGVTALALLALALGIGANSAIFCVVYAVLLRPLPVRDADRLVTFALSSKKLNVTGAPPGFTTYAAWKRDGNFFESIAASEVGTAAFSAGAAEETVKLWRVTASFLPTLGVQPAIGRNLTAEEDRPGGVRVALVANTFWRGRLNGDPRALGTAVKIDGEPYTVVGVLPPGFHVDGRPADVYVPLAKSLSSEEWLPVNIYARLKPGVTLEKAQALMDERHLDGGRFAWEARLWFLRDFQTRNVRLSLWVLLGAVGLVLLIACSNTATLLLARASARQEEIAVRNALGAGRGRILRQLLTESTVLAVAGGACGVLVAMWCARLVPLIQHERLPALLDQTRVDGAVLAFTLAISILTGLVFGMAPALSAARVNIFGMLKEGGRSAGWKRRTRAWNLLIVSETALAVLLAIGASLLIRTFFYLRDVAPGFSVDNLLTARITPPRAKFTSRDQCIRYWQSAIDQVRRIPGVEAASYASTLPLTGEIWVMTARIEGRPPSPRPEDNPMMWHRVVDTGYFRTMRVPLRSGRTFNDRDTAGAPSVIIVNETLARRFWPGQNPIGKHLGGDQDVPLLEVVGVVEDVRAENTTTAALPEVYLHLPQAPTAQIALAVRVDPRMYRNPMALEPAVRRAIALADPTQPVTKFAEMQRLISDRIAPNRLSAQLIAIFAGLALVLAAVGIYGVLSFSVAQRTPEIGLRVALGAGRGRVLAMILKEAMLLSVVGVALGMVGALGLTRVLTSLLFGVGAMAGEIYAVSGAGLLAISALAAAVPAYRAARVDPLVALRHE
jgi:putative ABC transport system permease protein